MKKFRGILLGSLAILFTGIVVITADFTEESHDVTSGGIEGINNIAPKKMGDFVTPFEFNNITGTIRGIHNSKTDLGPHLFGLNRLPQPGIALDIDGPIQLGNIATNPVCNIDFAGSMYFDTGADPIKNNHFWYCNGADWRQLDTDCDSCNTRFLYDCGENGGGDPFKGSWTGGVACDSVNYNSTYVYEYGDDSVVTVCADTNLTLLPELISNCIYNNPGDQCLPNIDDYETRCHSDGNIWWYDDCGKPTGFLPVESCNPALGCIEVVARPEERLADGLTPLYSMHPQYTTGVACVGDEVGCDVGSNWVDPYSTDDYRAIGDHSLLDSPRDPNVKFAGYCRTDAGPATYICTSSGAWGPAPETPLPCSLNYEPGTTYSTSELVCSTTPPSNDYCVGSSSYQCIGTIPANAAMCQDDNLNLTADVVRTLTGTCGFLRKCEYFCNSGFHIDGDRCVVSTYQCIGPTFANATMCHEDSLNLTEDVERTLTNTCGLLRKCEYFCNSGFHIDGDRCVADTIFVNAECKEYSDTYASQPASSNATGCTRGNYRDTADGLTHWRWYCDGSGGGLSYGCAANRSDYDWDIGDWEDCEGVNNPEGSPGIRNRTVVCKNSSGMTVNDSYCSAPKPDITGDCSKHFWVCGVTGRWYSTKHGCYEGPQTCSYPFYPPVQKIQYHAGDFVWTSVSPPENIVCLPPTTIPYICAVNPHDTSQKYWIKLNFYTDNPCTESYSSFVAYSSGTDYHTGDFVCSTTLPDINKCNTITSPPNPFYVCGSDGLWDPVYPINNENTDFPWNDPPNFALAASLPWNGSPSYGIFYINPSDNYAFNINPLLVSGATPDNNKCLGINMWTFDYYVVD